MGETTNRIGYVHLLTTFGDKKGSKHIMIKYLLVDANTLYNVLIGRPFLNELSVIISTPHLKMKFPRECCVASLRIGKGKKVIDNDCRIAPKQIKQGNSVVQD